MTCWELQALGRALSPSLSLLEGKVKTSPSVKTSVSLSVTLGPEDLLQCRLWRQGLGNGRVNKPPKVHTRDFLGAGGMSC